MRLAPPQQINWVAFYMEFANKLLAYKDKRDALVLLLKDSFQQLGLKDPFFDKGQPYEDICPFTTFGCFNKGLTTENRTRIMGAIGSRLGVVAPVPDNFDGVPVLMNMSAWFFLGRNERAVDAIDNLWEFFEHALKYADDPTDVHERLFVAWFDKVRAQPCVKWNLTMGLFWIRPNTYLNLDSVNREQLTRLGAELWGDVSATLKLQKMPSATEYLRLIDLCRTFFTQKDALAHSFPELSLTAWREAQKVKGEPIKEPSEQTRTRHYWMYAPGERARLWDEVHSEGIMAIGWEGLGDLAAYESREDILLKMQHLYGADKNYRNDTLANWQFLREIRIGDIVYAKRGLYEVIGRGEVVSDYYYDSTRAEYRSIRKVQWMQSGSWEHPGQAVSKTLTDITQYTEYVQKLELLILGEEIETQKDAVPDVKYESYSDEDFLNDVFMDEQQYDTLVSLLKAKQNLVLQGAPGVGKTYIAKRLAYSMIGRKDESRVRMVQFHQSYSYEDFMLGYRPTQSGFELREGPFYQFCQEARNDPDKEFFFIIDEINRGNLGKIFGELMMLIEKDKRGESLSLLYRDEQFSVPKNLYIIGLMNTADRSLALMDYALRRRFAFYTMTPAFDSQGFRAKMEVANSAKYEALIGCVLRLNEAICKDDSLGEGFVIGHSYFCPAADQEITEAWLHAIVKHELLPLLREYWYDESSKVDEWTTKLYGALK